MESAASTWQALATQLKLKINEDQFQRWFSCLEAVTFENRCLTLRAPNSFHLYWIQDNYLGLLRDLLSAQQGETCDVKLEEGALATPVPPAPATTSKHKTLVEMQNQPADTGGLNPSYTFDTFVIGEANRFAHAAAMGVASAPAKTYNPLFIYGGVGLGKTHLMHAVGHAVVAKKRHIKVVYITAESFVNEFIEAVKSNALVKFRKRYRSADMLLIDDIQFFADKEKSQEEFFHTFNTLKDGHKQIILTCDRPACDIANLEKRLVSRFEWGMSAEIGAPDKETREAILRRKAQTLNIHLPDPVFRFIAERIQSNVRRLEGALIRLGVHCSLNGGQISLEKAEQLLRDILQEEARRVVTVDAIQRRVAETFDIRVADITGKKRPAHIAFPRQIAMYLSRQLTGSSLSEIGEHFGGRDHGTVIHACKLVKDRMEQEEKIRQTVQSLLHKLERE